MRAKNNYNKGFTIIELVVVIAIIAILAAIVLVNINGFLMKGRDAKRKADLHNLSVALKSYYAANGSYPVTGNPTNARDSVNTIYSGYPPENSGWFDFWNSTTINSFLPVIPIDPLDDDAGPWCWSGATSKNNIYTYTSDGTHFILCGWLENSNDSARLELNDVTNPFNPVQKLYANQGYSKYNFVIAE